jgi:hypothetical protein
MLEPDDLLHRCRGKLAGSLLHVAAGDDDSNRPAAGEMLCGRDGLPGRAVHSTAALFGDDNNH